jgi:hypothetical protein
MPDPVIEKEPEVITISKNEKTGPSIDEVTKGAVIETEEEGHAAGASDQEEPGVIDGDLVTSDGPETEEDIKALNDKEEKPADEPGEKGSKEPGKRRKRNRVSAPERIKQLSDQKKGLSEKLLDEQKKTAELEAKLKAKDVPEKKPSEDEPADDGKPKQEDFETYDDFIVELSRWAAKSETPAESKPADEKPAETTSSASEIGIDQETETKFVSLLELGSKKHDDFLAKVQSADLNFTPSMIKAASALGKNAEDVVYEIANDPELALELATLGDNTAEIAAEMGKVMATLSGDTQSESDEAEDTIEFADDAEHFADEPESGVETQEGAEKPKPKTTSTPEPIDEVAPGGVAKVDPETEDMDHFMARRRKEYARGHGYNI